MRRVPEARGVTQALRSLRAAAQGSLKAVNQLAAQRMTKGDYESAEALAGKGKEIRDFLTEVDALRGRWRELCGGASRGARSETTPLWAYYQPVLRALVEAGGEATRSELEPRVEGIMRQSFLPGDRVEMARGRERWRAMVGRARKPLVAEGWIEDGRAKVWRITDAGREVAEEKAADGAAMAGKGERKRP